MNAPPSRVPTSTQPIQSSAYEAQQRAERIRSGVYVLAQWEADVIAAYASRDWVSLGYASWEAYLDGEFGEHRIKLPRGQRQVIVAGMTANNMSTRAIAATMGVDQKTIVNDRRAGEEISSPSAIGPVLHDLDEVLREAGIDEAELADADTDEVPADAFAPAEPQRYPQRVIGTDGKTYATAASRPATPQRAALPPQFQSASAELSRVIARFERLQIDDRYRANRESITTQCLPEIRRAAEVLHALLADLGHENGGPQ